MVYTAMSTKTSLVKWRFEFQNSLHFGVIGNSPLYQGINSVGMWCQNDVVSTSIRRHHVASTLIRRHFFAMCPLGTICNNIFFFQLCLLSEVTVPGYETILGLLTQCELYFSCTFTILYNFTGLIRRTPSPTFSDTALTDRHSDIQLRAHWVRISLSIGLEKWFRNYPRWESHPRCEHPIRLARGSATPTHTAPSLSLVNAHTNITRRLIL